MERFEPGGAIPTHQIYSFMDDALSALKAEMTAKRQRLESMSREGKRYIRVGEVEKAAGGRVSEKTAGTGGTQTNQITRTII